MGGGREREIFALTKAKQCIPHPQDKLCLSIEDREGKRDTEI